MKKVNSKKSATPKHIIRNAHESENQAIVFDDYAGVPMRVTYIDGRWWVTTPNNFLKLLSEQYGGMETDYFYLCAPGEEVGALSLVKLLGKSIENPCFAVETTLRHRMAELKRLGVALNPKDEALTLELELFTNPPNGRRQGKYSLMCCAVGDCYEPLFDCDAFACKEDAVEYGDTFFDFLKRIGINYTIINKKENE